MEMVGGSSYGEDFKFLVFRDAEDIGVKLFAAGFRDEIGAVFRAKDAMHEICGIGMRHWCRPSRDSPSKATPTQRLRAGLTDSAPSGHALAMA